ncbi:MAG TPA: helix-turn-helix domain-containing protein, partial [Roseiflexaceae bacterium]|nr:helix-turn-helix domain-containing protein [Roseiflexaceae bacterium]
MEARASFGYWMRRRRKALDLTQQELAQQLGSALGTIQKLEADERRPSRQLATRLADLLQIPSAEQDTFVKAARAELAADRLEIDEPAIEQPPLRAPDTMVTNLPVPATRFIGREREVAVIHDLICRDDVRLVTLTGPGGAGKSRLCVQVAAELLGRFEHGVWFVNLAPVNDPNLVASTIADALGVRETAGISIVDLLKRYVREKRILLLLDNFEHVVEAAPLISELLAFAPNLKMLVTSRITLRLLAEREFVVMPLGLSPTGHQELRSTGGARLPGSRLSDRATPAELSQCEAVRLFIQRAQAMNANFTVTNENAPAIAEICYRLDGLPLAIELAAARIKMFPPQALLERLGNRLKFLTGGARDQPARQQTIRNTVDWSYNLLDEREKILFARLGVFVGGCS